MRNIELTAEIAARIEKLIPGTNIGDLTVFEAVALNYLPVRQKHPLYEGAVAQPSMMQAMSERTDTEQVPLYAHHNDYGSPLGFVFHSAIVDRELRAQFALDNGEEDFLRKVQNGTYAQVSVANLAAEILCSECGWNYLSEEATFENIYMGICGNDHKLRENGVHAELHGLQQWFELSLVDLGGLAGAHIVSPSGAKLQNHRIKILAAGNLPDKLPLISTFIPSESSEEETEMDTKELLARLETKIEEASALKAEKQALVVEKDDLVTKLEAAEKQVKVLSADPDEKLKAKDTEIASKEKEITELKAKLEPSDKVLEAARGLVTKLSIMSGDAESKFEGATAEELTAKFGEYVENLKKIIIGGATASLESKEDDKDAGPAAVSAFRIVK